MYVDCGWSGSRFLVALILFAASTCFVRAAEPFQQQVRYLVADVEFVELVIGENVKQPKFRRGPCVLIRGIIEGRDWLPEKELLGFTLQRQGFREEPTTPVDANWDTVDDQIAFTILQEAYDYADEEVQEAYVSPILTMPLPLRQPEKWGSNASHPQLIKRKPNDLGKAWLFRYVDFDVEPAHWYRYRVKLEVQKEKPKNSVSDGISGPWSDATKIIEVKESKTKSKSR